MSKFDIVVSDFIENPFNTRVNQKMFNDYIAWLITSAQHAQDKNLDKKNLLQQFYKYAVSQDIIHFRHAIPVADMLNDQNYSEQSAELPSIFANIHHTPQGEDIGLRSKYFEKIVIKFLEHCYPESSNAPEEIVHVTSMAALVPNPVQRFLTQRQWNYTTITNAYFYGCHGSIPALRTAVGSLLNAQHQVTKPNKSLDLVHTEFLTLHMNTMDLSPSNIIGSTLFSDGLIKYTLKIKNKNDTLKNALKIIYLQEKLLPNSSDEMLWEPGPYQYNLFLSKKIPALIGLHIQDFVINFCKEVGINFVTEKNNLVYAFHPGGSQILDAIEKKLNLTKEQIKLSRNLLYEQGNISSVSLPTLWHQIIHSTQIKSGTKILSISCGPGLTIAAALLEKL